MNLPTNSVHAMAGKGKLAIKLETTEYDEPFEGILGESPAGQYTQLTVSDTGTGIPQASLNRIFDPFFTTKGVGEGTGMGLSVVYGIVQDHAGNMTVDSDPNTGTTFNVYLPQAEARETEEFPEMTAPTGGAERVLFVDDEELIIGASSAILQSMGYEVVATSDSQEALALFKASPEKFDILITDQSMPNMTGAELVQQMLASRPGLPVILCTGYSCHVDKKQLGAMGVTEYLMKPIKPSDLDAAIRRALDSR